MEYLIVIILVILLQWIIGKLIGINVSPQVGVILGVVLILFGFSFVIGVTCIVYSQKNENTVKNINVNINQQSDTVDTIECPYCAEKIKKNAKICRYCNNTLT